MRRNKRKKYLLFLSSLSFLGLSYLIFSVDPSSKIQLFSQSEIWLRETTLFLFFFLLLTFLSSLLSFVLNNIRSGIFISFFIVLYFFLRLNHFNQPFFLIILTALFLTLGLLFKKKK